MCDEDIDIAGKKRISKRFVCVLLAKPSQGIVKVEIHCLTKLKIY
jgi:hypothetical protein